MQTRRAGEERSRQKAALGGILQLHRTAVEEVIQQDIAKWLPHVEDANYDLLIDYVATFSLAWDASDESVKQKVRILLETATPDLPRGWIFGNAATIDAVRHIAVQRLGELSHTEFSYMAKYRPIPEMIPLAIEKVAGAKTFRTAETEAESRLLPLAPIMTAADVTAALQAAQANYEVWDAARIPDILESFFRTTGHVRQDSAAAWKQFRTSMQEHNNKWRDFGGLDAAMSTEGL